MKLQYPAYHFLRALFSFFLFFLSSFVWNRFSGEDVGDSVETLDLFLAVVVILLYFLYVYATLTALLLLFSLLEYLLKHKVTLLYKLFIIELIYIFWMLTAYFLLRATIPPWHELIFMGLAALLHGTVFFIPLNVFKK